jgi:hypothetical protein
MGTIPGQLGVSIMLATIMIVGSIVLFFTTRKPQKNKKKG